MIDVTAPECETPLHVHHREDETFIVLEGEIEFNIGGQRIEAGPGTTVFGPRDVPHAYIVRKGPSRMLFLFTPAGFGNGGARVCHGSGGVGSLRAA